MYCGFLVVRLSRDETPAQGMGRPKRLVTREEAGAMLILLMLRPPLHNPWDLLATQVKNSGYKLNKAMWWKEKRTRGRKWKSQDPHLKRNPMRNQKRGLGEESSSEEGSSGHKEGAGEGEDETLGEGESEGFDKVQEEVHGVRESEGSEEGSREEDSEESYRGEEEGNGEGEEDGEGESSEGANEDEEERTRDKARGKWASSSSRVVEEATDDPSRPIPGGPTDRSILVSFNNHVAAAIWKNECVRRAVDVVQKWKALPARSHTVGYASGPSKRKHSGTDEPSMKRRNGKK
ncbi:hypothetical protein Scep_024220 [Stephania cephalantha]|uniref:Uncharacterized protein n=1 Tax=Stephania cephalantha TaxID=152367 RepID=A0AAP0EYW9_9MAGN